MHLAEPLHWDVPVTHPTRPFPTMQFNLFSIDAAPEETGSPALVVSPLEETFPPRSFEARSVAQLDQVVQELERTVVRLRGWRDFLALNVP